MKRMTLMLVLLLLPLALLFSCKTKSSSDNSNQNTPGDNNTEDSSDVIYSSSTEPLIVTNIDSLSSVYQSVDAMANDIYTYTGKYPRICNDTYEKAAHEIVVGDTSRPISVKAKQLLDNAIRREFGDSGDIDELMEDRVGYAVYADGGSVAIVWTDWHLDETAASYLLNNYVTEASLKLEDGYFDFKTLSLNEFLDARGQQIRDEQWKRLETAIGKEYGSKIIDSLKNLYKIYDSDAVSWLANLYDADIGGFYFSNSARNTIGFLPDIESTYGVLCLVEETGMAEMFDNDYTKALPSWMLEQIGSWIQSLQDEDGYFYHPQWPKEYLYERGLQSRMTRDLGSARSVLRKLGIPENHPTSSLIRSGKLSVGGNAAIAVSKVVQTAGMLSQFESVSAFQNYVNALDEEVLAIKNPDERAYKLYAIGNEFQSTTSMVKSNPEFVTILYRFFEKHQDPDTGTWSSVVTYNAANGLHKISHIYNSLGLELQYVDEMVKTMMDLLSRDVTTDPINAGVEVYNAWSSLGYIYENLRRCSSNPAAGQKKLAEVKEYVYAHAVEAIDATTSQISGFMREDGSAGYNRDGSSSTAQGCPIAVSGTVEGDVNGYSIVTTSITKYIASALDFPELEVKLFSEKERVEFVRILEDLGTIIKDADTLLPDVPATFEDGEIPENFHIGVDSGRVLNNGASVTVDDIDGNKVLHVIGVHRGGEVNGRNHGITIPINLTSSQANAAIIEFDLYVNDNGSDDNNSSLIEWVIRGKGGIILYPRIGTTSAGKVMLYDSNRAPIAVLGNIDQKIKFRFEYYWAEGEYKVYVNDLLKGKGNNLYSSSLINNPVTEMLLCSPSGTYSNYYLDNLRCSRVEKKYNPDDQIQYPEKPETEDFEGEINSVEFGAGYNVITEKGFSAVYPSNKTNNGGATAVVRTDEETGNKFLSVYAPTRANDERGHSLKMSVPTEMRDYPNAYVFETSIKLNSVSTSKGFLEIVFLNQTKGYRYGQINMTTNDDGLICLAGLPIGYYDQWFNLKLEYYLEVGVIRVYNDNLYMGEITTFTSSDSITAKDVSALGAVTGFSVSVLNSGGSASFSIDNFATSLNELEYDADRVVDTLPAPTPDPDDFLPEIEEEPDPTPDPDQLGTGVGTTPDPDPDEPGTGGGTTPDPDPDEPGTGGGTVTPPAEIPEDNETEAPPLPGEGTSPDDYLPSDPDGFAPIN